MLISLGYALRLHGSVIGSIYIKSGQEHGKQGKILVIETYFFDGLTAGISMKNARNSCKIFATC